MKEIKYQEVTGLTDKNTFHQFDQWENQAAHLLKNRYIYDFSFPVYPGKTEQESFYENEGTPGARSEVLKNLSDISVPNNSPNTAQYGFPGDRADILFDTGNRLFTDSSGQALYTYSNFERTTNPDEATIAFDGDALGYVDFASPKVFSVPLDNWVDYFRAGYVEFAIKTNKNNRIIASGTTEADANNFNFLGWLFGNNMENGATQTGLAVGDTASSNHVVSVDSPYYTANSFDGALVNLNIEVSPSGKILVKYYDKYNRDDVSFSFEGNKIVSDNEWHHVVINFGRPGLIKEHGLKFNKRFVEIWIDGKLDKRFDEKVNDYQIFYPTVKWLFNNLKESVDNVLADDIDLENNLDLYTNFNIGLSEIFGSGGKIFDYCVRNSKNKQRAFSGAMHLFAHGVNIPLSQYEIKQRFRLWRKDTKKFTNVCNVAAEMIDPTVSTNSKKILKLYWNENVLNGKNGVTLDENYQVESYSVTHQSSNSKTEIFNKNIEVKKENAILKNVRAAFGDNVIVNGPGMVYISNLSESYNSIGLPYTRSAAQFNPKDNRFLDSVTPAPNYDSTQAWFGPRSDLYLSGISLQRGDRILLTNQIKTEENGIWIYNGLDAYLTRDTDSFVSDASKNYIVYIFDGYYKNTYWKSDKTISSLSDPQKWSLLEVNDLENINILPMHTQRWKDYYGEDRFISFQNDVDLSRYDVIAFMNYPETNEEIFSLFPNDSQAQVLKQYADFVASLKLACAEGASLMVTSPKLAEDLGIVRQFTSIDQEIESGDGRSAVVNPFQFGEPAERYFDTHRQNAYHLDTEVPGLTNKTTWVLTEAIDYLPKDEYDYEQWHLKYSYRQFGLKEGNEFLIPTLPLRQVALKEDLPGFRANARLANKINVVAPNNVLAGTVVTSLANNHYHGANTAANEFDDYATTIIVHNGQQLGGTPINGKIFVNCVEDAYTMSREEYNKAVIQVIPENDPYETSSTRQWQYSTSRLNRLPKRINVKELTNYGQTTPTNGGGGPLVQAATNSSNGIIRSETDRGNKDYQSDLYPQESEEVYTLQEIPVLSMTWLGLQWLAGN